jgi:hypothetical protein
MVEIMEMQHRSEADTKVIKGWPNKERQGIELSFFFRFDLRLLRYGTGPVLVISCKYLYFML